MQPVLFCRWTAGGRWRDEMKTQKAKSEAALFRRLARADTPSVCNALELVLGERQESGFTRRQMVFVPPTFNGAGSGAFIGRAKTATLRAVKRKGAGTDIARRMAYYRYAAVRGAVVVIEDLDRPQGLGAFWGEVHSAVHSALGVAGVVTTGAVRDLPQLSPKLPILAGTVTPSHAFVDIEQLDLTVDIFAMRVAPGDIIHADLHGAVNIPEKALSALPEALETVARREGEILRTAKKKNFSHKVLENALKKAREIH